MKIGCCTNMIATKPDGLGLEFIEKLAEIGYDYVELSNSHLMALDDKEFLKLSDRIERSGIKCEANNNFFPGNIKLTGNDVKVDRVIEYVKRSFDRLSILGSKVIVFGSAEARNVEPDFSKSKAWEQLVELLIKINSIAQQYNIIVAIEHLNKHESNIINTINEALELAKEVSGSNVGVLLDYYHMMLEEENYDNINRAGKLIKHVHFAKIKGRVFPLSSNNSYKHFFKKLYEINYKMNLSVEAYIDSIFDTEAKATLDLLRILSSYK